MISICMPYWDRQTQLDSSLDLYRALYPDVDLEVSIADDGSQTPVYATGCLITFLPKKAAALNPCVPINVAVKASHGDVIVLTNPEVHHRDQILQEMHAELRRAGTRGYVTASCRNDSGEWLAHSTIKGGEEGRGPFPHGSQFHFCAMLYRSLWYRAGGFDEDYRDGQAFDDNDWLWRLDDAGAQFCHRDDLIVHHEKSHTSWPKGGWHRNAALLRSKWGHRWL